MVPPLNRRHKTLLFLTVVGLGASLLLGADAKQVAGIALLGLAATWLIGGVSVRALGLVTSICALLVGTGVSVEPILKDWLRFRTDSNNYAQAIRDLTDAVRKSPAPPKSAPLPHFSQAIRFEPWPPAGDVVEFKGPPWKREVESRSKSLVYDAMGRPGDAYVSGDRIVDIPPNVWNLEGPWATPDFFADPVSVVVFPRVADQQILDEIERQLLVPKPSFSTWGSLTEHAIRSLSGLALTLCGLIGLVWWFRGRNTKPDHSLPSSPN